MKRLTPAIRQAVKKKGREVKWLFASDNQAEMIALAELGQSNKVITKATGIPDGSIQYALTKAQRLQGMKGGYRRAWANGESDICKQVKADLLAVLREEVQKTLPQKIVVPPPTT
jgi:hypothetical protein